MNYQLRDFNNSLFARIAIFASKPRLRLLIMAVILGLALLAILSWFALSAPPTFTADTVFTIQDGMTLDQIAVSLKSRGYVRSESSFKFIVKHFFLDGRGAVAGDYSFEKRLGVFSVARRIVSGDFGLEPVVVTVPEGLNKFETGDLLAEHLPGFDKEKFVAIAPEGYLFPDTYFFTPNVAPQKVVEIMRNNFDRRIESMLGDIAKFGRPLDEVIIMASIVETEARKYETRQTIAGILWKRFDEGMALQVDVSFKYVNGKNTFNLTTDDLNIDSPYNSYRYAGLPPTAIANPGLDSILATITPIETEYFYFLSDKNGVMHYAMNFEEHKKNKRLYLR